MLESVESVRVVLGAGSCGCCLAGSLFTNTVSVEIGLYAGSDEG